MASADVVEKVKETTNSEEVLAADGDEGNFTELYSLIKETGRTNLTLEKNYKWVEGDDTGLWTLNKDFTIDGQGKYTIDGSHKVRIFDVGEGSTFTIRGVKLINAGVDQNSAAIISRGNLIVDNCAFEDNNLIRGSGINPVLGLAIVSYGGKLTVTNSNFTDNLFNQSYYEYIEGGAIGSKSTDVYIENCIFKNNPSKFGAVMLAPSSENRGKAIINNSKFENNDGGAIYAQYIDLSIINSQFINNTAVDGAAVDFKGDTLTVKGSNFTSNNATASGGAIYVVGDSLIAGCNFTKNTANDQPNAIYLESGTLNVSDNKYDVYENAIINAGGTINKPGSMVTIRPIDNVTSGEPVFVEYSIENRSSNVTVTVYIYVDGMPIKDETAICAITDDNITITNIGAGQYLITINNHEDANYKNHLKNENFHVKFASSVTIDPIVNVTYGEPVVVKYDIQNRSSNVTVSVCYDEGGLQPEVDGAVVDLKDNNITISNLTVGRYVVFIYNNDDDSVGESSGYAFFNVTKAIPTFDATVKIDEYGEIFVTATINEDATSDVWFKIDNGAETYDSIKDGQAEYRFREYDKNTHNITVTYGGDDNYLNASKNLTVTLTKEVPEIEIISADVNEYGAIVVNANITKGVSGNVTFKFINTDTDKNFTVSIEIGENGTIEYDELTPFEKGFYTVIITYDGNDDYYGAYESKYVDVNKTVPKLDVYNVTVNEFGHIIVLTNVTKGATGIVTYVLTKMGTHEQRYFNITVDENATADLDEIAPFDKGEYKINVWYNGDENYYGTLDIEESADVTRNQITSNYEAVVTFNEVEITITFPANATGNITVFYPSGANGSIPINSTVVIDEIFDNGNQWILVTYPGDANYYGFDNYNITFFVKASSFIKAGNVNVVYLNKGKVTVTLTDNNDDGKGNNPVANAPVTITLNGKTYKGTTNVKGIATITIAANMLPKAYTAKVAFAGSETINGDDDTFKFTVKKATPKLNAKKKTFKAKTKTKKYTIVLKNNKGKAMKKVKVYLKVKGKTYTAKTNSKGKAVFKIKNLKKKGTYKAKVTFKATKYFNKVTKTVKIKVKR